MVKKITSMPEKPCNTGCPRSNEGTVANCVGWVVRRLTAQQDGCGYREECAEREIRQGLTDYRGDQTYLAEQFGILPSPHPEINEPHPEPGYEPPGPTDPV